MSDYTGIMDKHARGAMEQASRSTAHYPLPTPRPSKATDKQEGGSHYKHFAIQPAVYCHKNGLGTCESNIIKYATRHKLKGGAGDVRKIIHYAQLLLELEYGVK